MPLTGSDGYQYSLPMFCPEILENAAILYIWVTPEAVSYTHLDVYKRQDLDKATWAVQKTSSSAGYIYPSMWLMAN